jgi:hypothetical protein
MGLDEFIRVIAQQTLGGVEIGACGGGGEDDMPKPLGKGKWQIALLGSDMSKGRKGNGKEMQRAIVAYREVLDNDKYGVWSTTLQSRRTLASWNNDWQQGANYKKDIEKNTLYYVELEEDYRNPQKWENPENHQVIEFYPLVARVCREEPAK